MVDADQDGVTIEEWLENLSENDRQKLIDRLIQEPLEERV
jgi:hypothetical protein